MLLLIILSYGFLDTTYTWLCYWTSYSNNFFLTLLNFHLSEFLLKFKTFHFGSSPFIAEGLLLVKRLQPVILCLGQINFVLKSNVKHYMSQLMVSLNSKKITVTITIKLLPPSLVPPIAFCSLFFWRPKCFYVVHVFFDTLPAAYLLTF